MRRHPNNFPHICKPDSNRQLVERIDRVLVLKIDRTRKLPPLRIPLLILIRGYLFRALKELQSGFLTRCEMRRAAR